MSAFVCIIDLKILRPGIKPRLSPLPLSSALPTLTLEPLTLLMNDDKYL